MSKPNIPFSKMRLASRLLTFFLLLSFCAFAQAGFFVIVDYNIEKDDSFTTKNMFLAIGPGDYQRQLFPYPSPEYAVQLLDKNGEIIEQENFSVQFIFHCSPECSRLLDETDGTLAISFDERARSLRVIHGDYLLYEEPDLQAALCTPNGICDEHENMLSCSPDCFANDRDNFCSGLDDDGVCDPDCGYMGDADCADDHTYLDDPVQRNWTPEKWKPKKIEPNLFGISLGELAKGGVICFSLLFLLALFAVGAFLVWRALKRKPREGEEKP
ncbi:MAG: hypothetical protein ABIH99_04550 [Candidatus Micrarchaeota archaeon]